MVRRCTSASSFFASSFDQAAGFSYDGSGDFVSAMYAAAFFEDDPRKLQVDVPGAELFDNFWPVKIEGLEDAFQILRRNADPLVLDPHKDIAAFVQEHVQLFAQDVAARFRRLG